MGSPQEGHHLSAGHRDIGTEGGGAGAVGHTVLHRPQHRFVVVVADAHIGEGVCIGLGADDKGHMNVHSGVGHGKGVFTAILGVQFQFISLAVSDGNFTKLISVIGLHGNGNGISWISPTRIHCDFAAADLVRTYHVLAVRGTART